ncbi:MAG: methyltransferase domain-containing protein [Deltaproteobacteria bacterium]|nr:methyltransferase domain-containing protein [Deltaproteobacteria bacterium]
MPEVTPWDTNAQQFNVHSATDRFEIDLNKLEFGVAANVMCAWPAVRALIDERRAQLDRALHIVDFGCGTGGFAQQCDDGDDVVTGIDVSAKMIATARASTARHIYYYNGGEQALNYFLHQDVIAANLVTNYLSSLTAIAGGVARSLELGGRFFFADLNPGYVRECLRQGIIYSDPEPPEHARHAILHFSDGAKRVTLWEPEDYQAAFSDFGLEFRSLSRPLLTEEFLRRFDSQIDPRYPRALPRYGIYAFEKTREVRNPWQLSDAAQQISQQSASL